MTLIVNSITGKPMVVPPGLWDEICRHAERLGEGQFQVVLNRVFAIRKPNDFALWADVLEALRAEVIN